MREYEIRTPQLNLLICKVILTDDNRLLLEFKNGKRVERMPEEMFWDKIDTFVQNNAS